MVNTLTVDNEAKQTIEALQTELQKTKEKLKAVEELKGQSGKKPCNDSYDFRRVGNCRQGFDKGWFEPFESDSANCTEKT